MLTTPKTTNARPIILRIYERIKGWIVFHLHSFFLASSRFLEHSGLFYEIPFEYRDVCGSERSRQRVNCVDRRVSGCTANWAVYKRPRKIHETRPFTLTHLYWAGCDEREMSPIDCVELSMLQRSCAPRCVPSAIRTKSYYPRMEVCAQTQPILAACGGPGHDCPCNPGIRWATMATDLSHALTVLLFTERSNLWLFIFAVSNMV